jgi:hypothetical protein
MAQSGQLPLGTLGPTPGIDPIGQLPPKPGRWSNFQSPEVVFRASLVRTAYAATSINGCTALKQGGEMTRKILIIAGCALAMSAFSAPRAVAADQGKVEQELMKIERSWCSASVKGDAAAIGAILADDYTDVLPTGDVTSKAQALSDAKTEKQTVCDIDMMQVRVYGDAAVVVGRTTWKSSLGNGQYRYTDMYIRRDGRWICVASHASDIKK